MFLSKLNIEFREFGLDVDFDKSASVFQAVVKKENLGLGLG